MDEILDALQAKYEATRSEGQEPYLAVMIDDVRFSDEAVIRLACLLDEIDPDWMDLLAWPEANGPLAPGR